MRISDWSSDVCSSDLRMVGVFQQSAEIADARRWIGQVASARKGAPFRRQDHRVRLRRPRLIERLDEFGQQLPAEHIELLGMEQDDGGDAVIDRETEAIEHVRALRRW